MMGLLYSTPVQGELRDCIKLVGDCEFYTCIEEVKDCGRFGYPRGFGKKYCERFEDRKDQFSSKGWEWIEKTRTCLINRLANISDELSCKKLKRQSFKDHVSCYLDGGFCELSKNDKKNVYKTIWPSLWRRKTLVAGWKIKKQCRQIKN
ncbi:MAG: hypothetical protein CME70_15340 [Halobacteriovorax sp.]|nr:hypothetical protein [Halobacteriovorax sp.]|tara:strand:+ start:63393 stop:63839 length:447 start_codon:yes stop_codon:yes gene_type:complete